MSEKKEVVVKRLPKPQAIQALLSNFELLNAGIPGIDDDAIVTAIKASGQFLYEAEIEPLLDIQVAKNPKFDSDKFVTILEVAGAIKMKAAPKFGEGGNQVLVDSEERALEVANSPELAPAVQDIMKKITALRDELKPLISDHATLSVALKNKKVLEVKNDKDLTNLEPVSAGEGEKVEATSQA